MFPFVATIAPGGDGAGTSNAGPGTTVVSGFTMPMPAGIVAGDLLIALVCASISSNATLTDATHGWAAVSSNSVSTLSESGTLGSTAVALYKVATGDANDVLSMARGTSCYISWTVYRIPASCWHGTTPPEGVVSVQTSGNEPNPPSLNPYAWGAEDTLWIAGFCNKNISSWANFYYPTNYDYDQSFTGATGNGTFGRAIMATRQLNAASEDPGNFGFNANGGHSFTLAVRPKAAANDVQKRLYFKKDIATGATAHLSLQDEGVPPAREKLVTGWVAANKASGQHCIQEGGVDVPTAGDAKVSWSGTPQPASAPSATVGDCWRSESTLNGTFANAPWIFTFQPLSTTTAYTGRFKLAVRLWRSADPDGVSNVAEITPGARVASAATMVSLATSVLDDYPHRRPVISWDPGGTVTLSNEYLFVQVAIEITSAGPANADVVFKVGSAQRVLTPIFSSGPTLVSYYPDADTLTGNWTPSESGPLYAVLSEASPSDAEYAQSGDNPTDDEMEVRFGDVATPGTNTNHIVSYRIKSVGCDMAVSFVCVVGETPTVLATWSHAAATIADWTTFNQTLDQSVIDDIDSYSDLRLRVSATANG